MFQDSSMAIEAFLSHLHQATNTRVLTIAKSVVDLIDFEFEPTLMKIATFPLLHTLKLPGLKFADVQKEALEEFLQLLQNNCAHLHTLDLSESLLDNECCNILAEMGTLNVLILNHCARLESAGVAHLLLKLKSLTRIDALRGKSSNVQNALGRIDLTDIEIAKISQVPTTYFQISEISNYLLSFDIHKDFL